MPLGTVDIRKFGGVRLGVDPGDVTMEAAVTASNVELAVDRSFVRTRSGLIRRSTVGAFTGTIRNIVDIDGFESLVTTTDGVNVRLYRAEIVGLPTLLGSPASAASSVNFAAFGTPTLARIYFASCCNVNSLLRRYDVAAGTITAAAGSPSHVGIMSKSNRLVQGAFTAAASSPTGANGSDSTVFFSDPGLPETYSANNYVHLRPGDGERIRAIVPWREQLFVFKETSVFIFYGESTSSTGNPIFDYRVLDLPGRIPTFSSVVRGPVAVAGPDGIYFITQSGVFRTTGGQPISVSAALGRIFDDESFIGGSLGVTTRYVSVHSNADTYVLDTKTDQWLKWSTAAGSLTGPLASVPPSSTLSVPEGIWWPVGSTLYYQDPTATNDDGAAIVSSYQTGHSDLGSAAIKTVKRVQLWGTGTVNVSMASDYGALSSGAAVVLGTAPTADTGYDTRALARGVYASVGLGASSGAWQVDGVTLQVRRPRTVGSKT